MIQSQLIWLILFLPVSSFLLISLFIRPFVDKKYRIAGYITIAAIAGAAALSVWTLLSVLGVQGHEIVVPEYRWLVIGNELNINVGIMVDALTAVMLVVVTTVSLMVQIYSLGYMQHDEAGYHRYYAWMSLFTASMLGLVLASNLLLIFVFWEMVGLCSYLLIGFWFHKPSAANAAKKAFIVTRLGDFGFLIAILVIFTTTRTFNIAALSEMAATGKIAAGVLTLVAIGIFSGAVGKSAQFPLHVWLPDAMEGPTPVSALIHSATMVSAGVFLVARTFPLFANSAQAVTTVAVIGGFTAIFAASMGLVANDIKRVLAYSTISQLGYMMLGLGAAGIGIAQGGSVAVEAAKAAVAIGIFHLFNHAFFKALLFLGSGSVNHTSGTFDMRLMGGLRRAMPWTYITFLIGSLSLAGIWPLAGFWSKDEIVALAWEHQPVLGVLAMITVFMTAFYMFRAVFMTFGGEYRGGAPDEHSSHTSHDAHGKEEHHLHESPVVMVAPMVFLSILAVISGFWNVTGDFGAFMGHGETHSFIDGLFGVFTNSPLPLVSLGLAGLGIFLAYAMYSAKWVSAERVGGMFKPIYTLFLRKYYMDELYEDVIVRKALLGGIFAGLQRVDTYGVDGTVNGVAKGTAAGGNVARLTETGQLQLYGLFMGLGITAIIIALFIFG